MKEIIFEQKVHVEKQVDVFVAGGGPAGIAAAVTAARMGASVFLAEKSQCFGGAAALSAVPAFMRFSDGVNFLAGGIGREVFDKLYEGSEDFKAVEFPLDIEKLKRIYDEMMLSSGVDFLFDTTLIGANVENGEIKNVILRGHERFFAVEAHTYIDCTGDASLSVMSGAHTAKGDQFGRMMPASLCSLWNNVDWSRAIVELGKDPDNRMLSKAFEDGVFTVQDSSLPGMWPIQNGMGGGNIGHEFQIDGTDERDLTKGIVAARKRLVEYQYYYNHYLEGYEKANIVSTGAFLGIRETRRVLGEYTLSNDDYDNRASFEDEIGRYCYPIDLHPVKPGAEKSKYEENYLKGYGVGNSYGIPYRTLLPMDTKNLLVAGRCISTSREMNGSTRVMPCCFITGMAAGAAAALAKESTLRTISIKKLQEELRAQGAYLPKEAN